jgi:hypothetical protein
LARNSDMHGKPLGIRWPGPRRHPHSRASGIAMHAARWLLRMQQPAVMMTHQLPCIDPPCVLRWQESCPLMLPPHSMQLLGIRSVASTYTDARAVAITACGLLWWGCGWLLGVRLERTDGHMY